MSRSRPIAPPVNPVEVSVEGWGKVHVDVSKETCAHANVCPSMDKGMEETALTLEPCKGDKAPREVGDTTFSDGEATEGTVSADELVTIGELVLATCESGGDCSVAMGGICATSDGTATCTIAELGYMPSVCTTLTAEGVSW